MSSLVYVYTITQVGQVGAWSRYIFPFPIDEFAQLGDQLYIRSGDDVLVVDDNALQDFAGDPRAVTFDGVVQWPWLDFGQGGVTKMVVGFDIVGTGIPTIQVGYDQSNKATFTDPFDVPADTLPGMIIPLPIAAPSMSWKITYAGGQAWKLDALNVSIADIR